MIKFTLAFAATFASPFIVIGLGGGSLGLLLTMGGIAVMLKSI